MLRAGSCSLQGRRPENEDAVAVAEFPYVVICAVADGMGGGGLAEQASQRAIAAALGCLDKPGRDRNAATRIEAALRQAFAQADEEMLTLQQQQGVRCASTLALALWVRGTPFLHLAHLGDCLAYRVRGQAIELLTVEHTIAEALVAAGRITREQARSGGWSRCLHRFLGAGLPAPDAQPDIGTASIQPDNRFLLCTDGVLLPFLPEAEVLRSLKETTEAQQCAERLCQLGLDHGSRDNVSCVVIEVVETE
jgi:protein phosphatase